MRALLSGFVLAVAACGARGHAEELTITNLRVGEVCQELVVGEAQTSRKSGICFETNEIHINGQGLCRAAGFSDPVPCTWYGYEFDYSGARPGEIITCKLTASMPGTYLNPREVVIEDSTSFEYEHALETPSGHVYNPQYSILQAGGPRGIILDDETVCFAGDNEVLRFRKRLIYP